MYTNILAVFKTNVEGGNTGNGRRRQMFGEAYVYYGGCKSKEELEN